jgi:hypothetical protein
MPECGPLLHRLWEFNSAVTCLSCLELGCPWLGKRYLSVILDYMFRQCSYWKIKNIKSHGKFKAGCLWSRSCFLLSHDHFFFFLKSWLLLCLLLNFAVMGEVRNTRFVAINNQLPSLHPNGSMWWITGHVFEAEILMSFAGNQLYQNHLRPQHSGCVRHTACTLEIFPFVSPATKN